MLKLSSKDPFDVAASVTNVQETAISASMKRRDAIRETLLSILLEECGSRTKMRVFQLDLLLRRQCAINDAAFENGRFHLKVITSRPSWHFIVHNLIVFVLHNMYSFAHVTLLLVCDAYKKEVI